MKIFLACPVRGADQTLARDYVAKLERQKGVEVYYPARDTPQDDPHGLEICETNRQAIAECDEFQIIWDGKSQGVLFDFGMAFALGKPIHVVNAPRRSEGKSFQNVMHLYQQRYGIQGRRQ